jgi:hypothetical protein
MVSRSELELDIGLEAGRGIGRAADSLGCLVAAADHRGCCSGNCSNNQAVEAIVYIVGLDRSYLIINSYKL